MWYGDELDRILTALDCTWRALLQLKAYIEFSGAFNSEQICDSKSARFFNRANCWLNVFDTPAELLILGPPLNTKTTHPIQVWDFSYTLERRSLYWGGAQVSKID